MSIDADLDHPIVEIVSRLLTEDEQHGWLLDQESVEFIERVLLDQRHDPKLPQAMAGMFVVATELHTKHSATLAAGEIFGLLGRLGPSLLKKETGTEEVFELVGRAKRSYRALLGDVPTPLR